MKTTRLYVSILLFVCSICVYLSLSYINAPLYRSNRSCIQHAIIEDFLVVWVSMSSLFSHDYRVFIEMVLSKLQRRHPRGPICTYTVPVAVILRPSDGVRLENYSNDGRHP